MRDIVEYCKHYRTTAGVRIDYKTLSRWTELPEEVIAKLAESVDKPYRYCDRVPGGCIYRISHFGLPKMAKIAGEPGATKLKAIAQIINQAL